MQQQIILTGNKWDIKFCLLIKKNAGRKKETKNPQKIMSVDSAEFEPYFTYFAGIYKWS